MAKNGSIPSRNKKRRINLKQRDRRTDIGTEGQMTTRMVQLPATAAIEYVAAGHFFPGGLLAGGTFVWGYFCTFA